MSPSTVPRSTFNASGEQLDDLEDSTGEWRNLAYALPASAAPFSGDAILFQPSDAARMNYIDEWAAIAAIPGLARNALRDRKTAAMRSAFEGVSERRSRPPRRPSAAITGMEKWEGSVTDVDSDFFTVQLAPVGNGTEVTADFPRELIADDDLQVGDVVYVTVRTIQGIGGPQRTSAVRLRRLGKWTDSEVAAQKARAKRKLARLEAKFA
jgi:hypothetical protein